MNVLIRGQGFVLFMMLVAGCGTSGTNGTTGGSTATTSATSGTAGTNTGGSTGGNTTSGLPRWGLFNTLQLPANDGGVSRLNGVVPLPLPAGVHRLVWSRFCYGNNNIYYSDDPFGPPIGVLDAGDPFTLYNLSGTAVDGGSVVAWSSILKGVQAAFIPDQGGAPQAIFLNEQPLQYFNFQGLSTFAGSMNGYAGAFLIFAQPAGGLAVYFTADNQSFSHDVIPVNLGLSGEPLFLTNMVGVSCRTDDIPSGSGFCFVAGGSPQNESNLDGGVLIVGAVDTGSATPTATLQRITKLPPNFNYATLGLVAMNGGAGNPDTVYLTAGLVNGLGFPTSWAKFTSLSTAPVLTPLTTTDHTLIPRLLPWAGEPLGLSLSMIYQRSGVEARLLPGGALSADLLPNDVPAWPASDYASVNGYTDVNGQPTIAISNLDAGTLALWLLPPTLDGG